MRVKICGLKTKEACQAAIGAGADYIGLVFFEKSPRNVSVAEAAALAQNIQPGICKTALVVNPEDAFLDHMLAEVPIDLIQLHGKESPDRVAQIKAMTGLPVMKAVGIGDESDLVGIGEYSQAADQILIDAKPPKTADLPGGNGLSFDWRLIANRRWAVPWMLAGGLTAENVKEAISLTGAMQIDVSSGVESAPGVKDPALIETFITAAKS